MAVIDDIAYAGLLAHGRLLGRPRVIETDAENERMIAELERLDSLPSKTAEEESLAELLTVLGLQFQPRASKRVTILGPPLRWMRSSPLWRIAAFASGT